VDVRVSKRVSISRRLRADGYVDMYNIMNGSAILTGTNVYGPRWLLPTTIVEGRPRRADLQVGPGELT